ncbi:MAG: sigma-54-dependent Fis family transcriptional regulator [Acidobacteria bacterium]|nr:sigma-54-dependent Fis family transcriptional regulator [Acidobacteriota bacterium]
MGKAKVLVIDDEDGIRDTLKMVLEYEGYAFLEARDGVEGLRVATEERPDLILLDIKMPHIDGLELLPRVLGAPEPPEVIVISGHGTVEAAVEATKQGAFDFLQKPLEREKLLLSIRNAIQQSNLRRENRTFRLREESRYRMVGQSPQMRKVWEAIEKSSPTNATVLIHGESGTGKELVARQIHHKSLRRSEAFVQVNCAAIPEELIESELFGHERGSFTGASDKQVGKFEQANGGTIFLDEVGDMSLKTQAKVLRALQEGEIERIGANRIIKVDVRVIAATNKRLEDEITAGRFREDLFFRLNVIPIRTPALRERPEDIPMLIEHFRGAYVSESCLRNRTFHPDALQALKTLPWRGNVRELKNVVERLLIMSDADVITVDDVLSQFGGQQTPSSEAASVELPDAASVRTLREYRDLCEKSFIIDRLRGNSWNISQTAIQIDVPRSNLYKKMEQYGIRPARADALGDVTGAADEQTE